LRRGINLEDYLAHDPGYERLSELLNNTYIKDPVEIDFIKNVFEKDPNSRNGLFIWIDNMDRLDGFGHAVAMTLDPVNVPEKIRDTLFIKIFAVREGLAKEYFRDHMTRIIQEIENYAINRGFRRVRIGGYPIWYIYPGVEINYHALIKGLESLGYKKISECVNYEVDLAYFSYPDRIRGLEESLIEQGLRFRRVSSEEIDLISKWVEENFGVMWTREIRLASLNNKPAIIIAENIKTREILGFSAYSTLTKNRFGPIGVAEKYRKLGIGSVLLYRSLQEMKNIGVRIAEIPWTNHLFFYSSIPGISRLMHFIILEKIVG